MIPLETYLEYKLFSLKKSKGLPIIRKDPIISMN